MRSRPRAVSRAGQVRLRPMTNWVTISSLASAGGTLVLAVATFASVRSGNRSARTADRAARIGERSLLHMYVGIQRERTHPPVAEFTSQSRDIYVAPGDNGFWQGAFRDPAAGRFKVAAAAIGAGGPANAQPALR